MTFMSEQNEKMSGQEPGETKPRRRGRPPKPPTESAGGTGVARSGGGAASLRDNREVRAAVVDAFRGIRERQASRSEDNAEIKAFREGLVARGLNKQALKDVERYNSMDASQRVGYDETIKICRSAIGAPVQADLFLSGEKAADDGADQADDGAAGTLRH